MLRSIQMRGFAAVLATSAALAEAPAPPRTWSFDSDARGALPAGLRSEPRRQIASWSGDVTSGAWHELRADVRGNRFEIYWDGAKVLEAEDGTFPAAGRVGVWTKADSVTLFDDLTVTPIEGD